LNGQWTFGVWRPDDVIVFAATDNLKQVSASGGSPSDLTTADETKGRSFTTRRRWCPRRATSCFSVFGIGTPRLDILQWGHAHAIDGARQRERRRADAVRAPACSFATVR
jgi:hypothetical protein